MENYDPRSLFSENSQKYIQDITNDNITSTEELIKIQEAFDKSYKLRCILNTWENQQFEERRLRKLYAVCFIIILSSQIVALNVAFFLIGNSIILISQNQFNVFFISMFGEITSLVLIITKYIFDRNKNIKLVDLMKNI